MKVAIDLEKIIFLDIETVSTSSDYLDLSPIMQQFWNKKHTYFHQENYTTAQESYSQAGLYAEFGKVICISMGVIRLQNGQPTLRIKSIYGDTEKDILQQLADLLATKFSPIDTHLVAHNGKEFDFQFLCKRYVINRIEIPSLLNPTHKKPWEVNLLDTMEHWKFGAYKQTISLKLLTHLLQIPPHPAENELDGSHVHDLYYIKKDFASIKRHCELDVANLTNVFLRLYNLPNVTILST